jgi:spore maturation protein CgeB
MGACLLTERQENLGRYFEPDAEVVTFGSPQEAAEKADYLLAHESERLGIARAGQARTLRDHTFAVRTRQLDEIIQRLL